MSRAMEGEKLAINANVVLLASYLFMGACLLLGAVLVLTQPLPLRTSSS